MRRLNILTHLGFLTLATFPTACLPTGTAPGPAAATTAPPTTNTTLATTATPYYTPPPSPTLPHPTSTPAFAGFANGPAFLFLEHDALYRFDLDGRTAQPIGLPALGEVRDARLNPDGRFLAYRDELGLKWLEVTTEETHLWLTIQTESPWERFWPLIWSQAGYLLVERGWFNENSALGWVVVGDDTWHNLPLPASTTAEFYDNDSGAAWSPNGTQLAVAGYPHGFGSSVPGLTVVDLDTGEAEQIITQTVAFDVGTEGRVIAGVYDPIWSPDGEWIAFGLDSEPTGPLQFPARLHWSRPSGRNLTPITDNATGWAGQPLWAADGYLYYSLIRADDEANGVYRYNPAGLTHTLLIAGDDLCPISLSPDGKFLLYGVGCGRGWPTYARDALKLWFMETGQALDIAQGTEDYPVRFTGWQGFASP